MKKSTFQWTLRKKSGESLRCSRKRELTFKYLIFGDHIVLFPYKSFTYIQSVWNKLRMHRNLWRMWMGENFHFLRGNLTVSTLNGVFLNGRKFSLNYIITFAANYCKMKGGPSLSSVLYELKRLKETLQLYHPLSFKLASAFLSKLYLNFPKNFSVYSGVVLKWQIL